MKSQQGFFVFGGIAWLAAAAISGAYIAVVESVAKHEATTTAQSQEQQSVALAVAPANPSVPEASAIHLTSYDGYLYRNGGHLGDKSSDVKLESIDP